jgi:hypothetical protein
MVIVWQCLAWTIVVVMFHFWFIWFQFHYISFWWIAMVIWMGLQYIRIQLHYRRLDFISVHYKYIMASVRCWMFTSWHSSAGGPLSVEAPCVCVGPAGVQDGARGPRGRPWVARGRPCVSGSAAEIVDWVPVGGQAPTGARGLHTGFARGCTHGPAGPRKSMQMPSAGQNGPRRRRRILSIVWAFMISGSVSLHMSWLISVHVI